MAIEYDTVMRPGEPPPEIAEKTKENGPRRQLNEPTLGQILSAVSLFFDIPEQMLVSHRRCAFLVRPRMIFYAVARDMTSKSFPQIGVACNRHHSAVLHGCRKVDKNIAEYGTDIDRVRDIVASINQDTPE